MTVVQLWPPPEIQEFSDSKNIRSSGTGGSRFHLQPGRAGAESNQNIELNQATRCGPGHDPPWPRFHDRAIAPRAALAPDSGRWCRLRPRRATGRSPPARGSSARRRSRQQAGWMSRRLYGACDDGACAAAWRDGQRRSGRSAGWRAWSTTRRSAASEVRRGSGAGVATPRGRWRWADECQYAARRNRSARVHAPGALGLFVDQQQRFEDPLEHPPSRGLHDTAMQRRTSACPDVPDARSQGLNRQSQLRTTTRIHQSRRRCPINEVTERRFHAG
jgi:hypothetical protein